MANIISPSFLFFHLTAKFFNIEYKVKA